MPGTFWYWAAINSAIGASEAAYLNKKDGDDGFLRGGGLKPGDETIRFNDIESILAAAAETFPALFDESDILIYERKRYSAQYEVLAAPAELRDELGDTFDRYEREEWFMSKGYLIHDGSPEIVRSNP